MKMRQAAACTAKEAQLLARTTMAVEALRQAALDAEREFEDGLAAVAPSMLASARNLVHYLAVRRHDIRSLQGNLARLGLSSLGRMESHVMATLCAVLRILCMLQGEEPPAGCSGDGVDFDMGAALLARHAQQALGPASAGGGTRIMVTMPGEAAADPTLIRDLLESGMNIMRVNCAHDHRGVWEKLIKQLQEACQQTGKRCLVSFDLAGPKLRTGPIESGPAVMKLRPRRDAVGRVTEPARTWLTRREQCEEFSDPAIPVDGNLIDRAKAGDRVVFSDARERRRVMRVVRVREDACLCEMESTAYLLAGVRMTLRRAGRCVGRAEVGALPPVEHAILLRVGDALEIVPGDELGRDAVHDDDGNVIVPAQISCDLPEMFTGVHVGEPILFDDGKIRGIVVATAADRLRVEITGVTGGAAKLRSEKGINLPESDLELPALTRKDIEDLRWMVPHADIVALSFVQRPADVEDLLGRLDALDAKHIGVVLKIETQAAFNRLPLLLLAAMRRTPLAVMVARGDLGVEVGFERLSEVQEETLWLCEAAHVPVIWATQVLESLAKGGVPSRAEVTDAAMGSRAECVMLNKGPYIRETLRFLGDVLGRMQEHQYKKTARLRRLRVSESQGRRRVRGSAKPKVPGKEKPPAKAPSKA